MTPQQQIDQLMSAVANQPPDIVVPCKKNQTHTLNIVVQWRDDLTPVAVANFKAYRGNAEYTTDIVAKGKYAEKKVPPGSYRVFFPDIHDAEIVEV